MSEAVFELRILLDETKPAVERTIQVRSETSLKQFHDLIQFVMGWKDCHLHLFEIDGKTYEAEDEEMGRDSIDEATVTLASLQGALAKPFRYIYDFGDDWIHTITLTQVLAPETNVIYPRCVSGKMKCPPEDCGGPHGYKRVKSQANKAEMIEWLGEVFDATAFDLIAVNKILSR